MLANFKVDSIPYAFKIRRMKIKLPMEWDFVKRVLSGNPSVENLIVANPLPRGNYWAVVKIGGEHWFDGQRPASLNMQGKGQISANARPGCACRLEKGNTSTGEPITFLFIDGGEMKGEYVANHRTPVFE